MSRMLHLTNKQIQVVQSAAQQVPASHRQDFLVSIADDLQAKQPFSDADVAAAVQRNVARWWRWSAP
jgi:hypothetical protein